jgi:hypothetical protein
MRPKRRILLVDADEDRLGIRRFVLRTHGFAVKGVSRARGAVDLLDTERPEVLVLVWPLEESEVNALLHYNANLFSSAATLLLGEDESDLPAADVRRFLLGRDCTPAKVLDAVKTCASRKRGPRAGKKKVSAVRSLMELLEAERFEVFHGMTRRVA